MFLVGAKIFFVRATLVALTTLTIDLVVDFGSCKKQGKDGNKLELTKHMLAFQFHLT
jgi:hypothetical protein